MCPLVQTPNITFCYNNQRIISKDIHKSAINNLRETIKNLNNKELASSTKHKIKLLGDSHLRGYACSLTPIISKDYDILGVVKPGSGSSELKESVLL